MGWVVWLASGNEEEPPLRGPVHFLCTNLFDLNLAVLELASSCTLDHDTMQAHIRVLDTKTWQTKSNKERLKAAAMLCLQPMKQRLSFCSVYTASSLLLHRYLNPPTNAYAPVRLLCQLLRLIPVSLFPLPLSPPIPWLLLQASLSQEPKSPSNFYKTEALLKLLPLPIRVALIIYKLLFLDRLIVWDLNHCNNSGGRRIR
jgi:hypothetical protein